MKQQFKLKKDGYYKERNRIILNIPLAMLLISIVLMGLFYFTGLIQKPFNWQIVYVTLLPLFFMFINMAFAGIKKEKIIYKNYKVIFDADSILFEQLGIWEETFLFFWSNYGISKRRIPYKEITEIRKSKTGYYTIKGEENSYPNTILISAEMENIETFEIALSEIKPITNHDATNDLKEYKFGKVALDKQKHQLYNFKTVSIILGAYLMVLLFSYFWFHPINWPLTIFLSVICFLAMFIFPYAYYSSNNRLYSLFIDKTAIISERERGNIKAIPFNEITSIKNNSYSLFITGKKISFAADNLIIIPNTIKNFDTLEQKLNAIHPITSTKKKRDSALVSNV